MTEEVRQQYDRVCKHGFAINEHIPVLRQYAEQCTHVTECGVESVISSWAFAMGLMGKKNAKLVQVDIYKHPSVDRFVQTANSVGINTTFYHQSDLTCPQEVTDLLFIDTWHVYGQLKRELDRWHPFVNQYIILHDTSVDEWVGESIRRNFDVQKQQTESKFHQLEITMGLWPAVVEFIISHPDWEIEKRLLNCNGLTVLKKHQ